MTTATLLESVTLATGVPALPAASLKETTKVTGPALSLALTTY